MQQDLLPIQDPPSDDQHEFRLDYPNAELVYGLVYAVGTDYKPVQEYLIDQIKLSGYRAQPLHLSEWFAETADKLGLDLPLPEESHYDRIDSRIKAGNAIRLQTERADIRLRALLMKSAPVCTLAPARYF